MPYSLTLNYTVPSTGFQFVTGYRVKYWPTNTPTAVSTVFTTSFPLVITDLNYTSYSGTIEAKCNNDYGTPRNFGPISVVVSGGGGGSAPACPYRIILFEDTDLMIPINSPSNYTSCNKPGYRIKLVTTGGAPVTVTGSEVSISVTYEVQNGDCASPTSSQTLTTALTIPAGNSISSNYIQTSEATKRINSVGFGTGNPTTVMSCATTYINQAPVNTGGGAASFTNNGTCSQGHGTYTLTGTAYDSITLQLRSVGNITPTNTFNFGSPTAAWLSAIITPVINGSTGNPRYAYSECLYQNSNYVTITANLTITMPASGSIVINTDVIKYNSEIYDEIQSQLSIISVNGGNPTGQYVALTNICSTNSQGQSQCPGPGSGSAQL